MKLHSPGGGGGASKAPPPNDLGRETPDRRENVHTCQVKCIEYYGNFNLVKNLLICIFMVIYANKVIKFTFLPINQTLFIFKHSFSLHIFVRPFGIIIQHKKIEKPGLFLMLSIVLIISYVFHCFFNLCILLFLLFYFISNYTSTILTQK